MISASCTSVNTETTLKDAYADSFMIGCAVNHLHTGGHLEQATDLILEHFNAISPENSLKPRPGVWTFDDADEFGKFGEEHDSWMLEERVQMAHWTKRAIRKKLHFTDEWHDLVAAIRKYGVFADGHALPVRDTGFFAKKGVSVEKIMLDDCSIAPDDSWVTVKIKQL